MKGKKFLAMILSAALGMSMFAACGSRGAGEKDHRNRG